MPYDIRKLPNQDLYRVFNKDTKSIHSFATTLENAKKQVALLEEVKEGEGIDNPKLYEKAKQIADATYDKPSAYKSGFIVKTYKEMGGTYSGKKDDKGIGRWFKEDWADVGNKDYPVYRPTKRVTIDTPLTVDEISPTNLKKQIALKQVIKGDANLPPFVGKGLTTIDKSSTNVMRIDLTDSAKKWLDNKVLPIITETTIYSTDSRKNSGKGRTQVFGYGMIRGKGFGAFKNNSANPELWNALVHFGMKVVPDYIPWTAIQVNHNYKTKKHIDGNNIGLSLAVSFGDFTGGELVVGNTDYQTKLHPVIFNGALQEHFNRPIRGNRYSLVYFVSAPKKYSDEQIFKLHNKVLDDERKVGNGLGDPFIVGGSAETDLFETDGVVSIPQFRSITIALPTYMFKRLPDMKGKPPPYRYRLVIPITKSRNLSSRKLETSINISQKAVNKPIADMAEIPDNEKPRLEDFSPEDRLKIRTYYENIKTAENRKLSPDEIAKDNYEVKQRGFPCYLYENCDKQGLRYKENVKQPKKKKQAKEKMGVIIPPNPDEDNSGFDTGNRKNRYYDKGQKDLFEQLQEELQSQPSNEPSEKSFKSKTSSKVTNQEPKRDTILQRFTGNRAPLLDDVEVIPPAPAKKVRKPRAPKKLPDDVEIQDEEATAKPAKKPRAPRGSKVAAAVANIEKKKPTPKKKGKVTIEEDDAPLTEAEQLQAETGSRKSSSSLDSEDAKLMKTDYAAWKRKNLGGKGLSSIDENKIFSNSKMPNKWITYVKEYASKNGMSYTDALKDPKCKAGYKTGSGVNKTFHTQGLVAQSYNDSELGANAGKKYISL